MYMIKSFELKVHLKQPRKHSEPHEKIAYCLLLIVLCDVNRHLETTFVAGPL